MRVTARELSKEVVGEVVLGLAALLLFAVVAGVMAWGWSHSKVGTIGVYACITACVVYGLEILRRSKRVDGKQTGPRGRLAFAASATAVVVAVWLGYVISYRPI